MSRVDNYRPPRTSPALLPLWPPTGRWQIHALLPTATACCCGISRESFGGSRGGQQHSRVYGTGGWRAVGKWGSGRCDAGCVTQTEQKVILWFLLQYPGALYGRQGQGWCLGFRLTPGPSSSFDHSWNTSQLDILGINSEHAAHTSPGHDGNWVI